LHVDDIFLPYRSSDEVLHKVRPQPDLLKVRSREIDLGEHILDRLRLSPRVAIDIRSRNMEHRNHLLDSLRHLQGMNISGGFKSVRSFLNPPIMFEVMPSTSKDGGVDRTGVTMTREDPGFTDSEEVDKVSLGGGEEERAEPDVFGLGDPEAFVGVVDVEDVGVDEVFGDGVQRRTLVRGSGDVGGSCHGTGCSVWVSIGMLRMCAASTNNIMFISAWVFGGVGIAERIGPG